MVIFNQGNASETLEMARFDELLRGRRRLVNALTNEALNPGEALEVLGWKALVLEAQG